MKATVFNQKLGGGGAEGASAPPKFSVDVPLFADEPFKCSLFERGNQKYR